MEITLHAAAFPSLLEVKKMLNVFALLEWLPKLTVTANLGALTVALLGWLPKPRTLAQALGV